jgi:hypothetical protein
MSTPRRTEIRDAVVAAINTIGAFGGRVHASRRRTLPRGGLPACCIYVEAEEKELSHMAPAPVFERRLKVVREIFTEAGDRNAGQLDELCALSEAALLADETLGGLCMHIRPESDEYDMSEEGAAPAAVAVCRDTATYFL